MIKMITTKIVFAITESRGISLVGSNVANRSVERLFIKSCNPENIMEF